MKCIFNQTKAQPPLPQDATPDTNRISQNLHVTKRLDGAVTPLSIIINIDIFPVSQISTEDVMGVELIAEWATARERERERERERGGY